MWSPDSQFHLTQLAHTRKISEHSEDPSTKVGALIIDPHGQGVSHGWNRFPRMMEHTPELLMNREEKYSRTVHAELMAILHAQQFLHGCSLYSSLLPCDRCAVVIIEAGIQHVLCPTLDMDSERAKRMPYWRTKKYFAQCGVKLWEIDIE